MVVKGHCDLLKQVFVGYKEDELSQMAVWHATVDSVAESLGSSEGFGFHLDKFRWQDIGHTEVVRE